MKKYLFYLLSLITLGLMIADFAGLVDMNVKTYIMLAITLIVASAKFE